MFERYQWCIECYLCRNSFCIIPELTILQVKQFLETHCKNLHSGRIFWSVTNWTIVNQINVIPVFGNGVPPPAYENYGWPKQKEKLKVKPEVRLDYRYVDLSFPDDSHPELDIGPPMARKYIGAMEKKTL